MNIDNKLYSYNSNKHLLSSPPVHIDCPPADRGNSARGSVFMLHTTIETVPYIGGEKIVSRSEGITWSSHAYHEAYYEGALEAPATKGEL